MTHIRPDPYSELIDNGSIVKALAQGPSARGVSDHRDPPRDIRIYYDDMGLYLSQQVVHLRLLETLPSHGMLQ